jgi:hypothetical protein
MSPNEHISFTDRFYSPPNANTDLSSPVFLIDNVIPLLAQASAQAELARLGLEHEDEVPDGTVASDNRSPKYDRRRSCDPVCDG